MILEPEDFDRDEWDGPSIDEFIEDQSAGLISEGDVLPLMSVAEKMDDPLVVKVHETPGNLFLAMSYDMVTDGFVWTAPDTMKLLIAKLVFDLRVWVRKTRDSGKLITFYMNAGCEIDFETMAPWLFELYNEVVFLPWEFCTEELA